MFKISKRISFALFVIGNLLGYNSLGQDQLPPWDDVCWNNGSVFIQPIYKCELDVKSDQSGAKSKVIAARACILKGKIPHSGEIMNYEVRMYTIDDLNQHFIPVEELASEPGNSDYSASDTPAQLNIKANHMGRLDDPDDLSTIELDKSTNVLTFQKFEAQWVLFSVVGEQTVDKFQMRCAPISQP